MNAFKIEILNGFLLCILIPVPMFYLMLFKKSSWKIIGDTTWYTKKARLNLTLTIFFYFSFIIISIFFIPGIIIFIIGYFLLPYSYSIFIKSPFDNPATKGIYKYSRNRQYLSEMICFLGIIIACLSYELFIIFIPYCFFQHQLILEEEKYCLKKYENNYRIYKNNSGRYLKIKIKEINIII